MKEHKISLADLDLSTYSLFLDRDGVINKPLVNDYVKRPEELQFTAQAEKAIEILTGIFKQVIVVTNQQGIGRNLMTEEDLENVHLELYKALKINDSWFDRLYYAPYIRSEGHAWRKPNSGMADQAFRELEGTDLTRCIVVGDSPGDMELAERIGAIKVRITNPQFDFDHQDLQFDSLWDFALNLTQN